MELLRKDLLMGVFFVLMTSSSSVRGQCALTKTLDPTALQRNELLNKLNSLPAEIRKMKFSAVQDEHRYTLQVCPDNSEATESAGVVQYNTKANETLVVGRFNESDVHASQRNDMIILTYTKGKNYTHACGKGERHAVVIIRCLPGITEFFLDMLSESVGMGEDFCFYTLELQVPATMMGHLFSNCTCDPSSRAVGPDTSSKTPAPAGGAHHGLGAGAIILIITLVSLLAFFAIGSVYKRFVAGAQGWEQVPFIDFWRKCGSLQADGFRYVFGRGRSAQGRNYDDYQAVSTDDERQPALDRNGTLNDDHLLPM